MPAGEEKTSEQETSRPETRSPAVKDHDQASIFYRLNFWVGFSLVLALLLAVVLVADTISYRHDHEHDHLRDQPSVVNNYYYYGYDSGRVYPQPYQPGWQEQEPPSTGPIPQTGSGYSGSGSAQPFQGSGSQGSQQAVPPMTGR